MNTVLLSGRGEAVRLTFQIMATHRKSAVIKECKRRWWEFSPKYEMRLQNLTHADIVNIQEMIDLFRPASTKIDMQVF